MLAGLHLKHVASRPKTLSAPPWVGWRTPAGLHDSLRVQLPPLGRCRPREVWLGRISSRIVASEIAGRPNAGRDYISCHDKRLGRFLVGLVKDWAGECRREYMACAK